MEEADSVTIQKRQAAIKLAKNLEPFEPKLGEEFDAIYVEILTEDIKQLALEVKKLATVIATWLKNHPNLLEGEKKIEVMIDGETEPVTKLMRRYSSRIQKMANCLYEVAYLDFAEFEQDEIKEIMKADLEDEGEDDE